MKSLTSVHLPFGKAHAACEDVHEVGQVRELDERDLFQQIVRAFELGAGQRHAAGADTGGVADGRRFAFQAGGQEPDAAGVLRIQDAFTRVPAL